MTKTSWVCWSWRGCLVLLVPVLVLGWPLSCAAYSVLTHETIIDAAWDTNIRPLLLKRFPEASEEELGILMTGGSL